jgi:hypothetical protein
LNFTTKTNDVIAAADDLRRRTLAHLPLALERMIYLASTRDYNSGLYHHQGLALRYSEAAACEGLADCHRESFRELLSASLEDLVRQLQAYAESTGALATNFITAWKELEPYRVAIPVGTDPLAADFVFSNLKVALTIFESRLTPRSPLAPLA